MYFGDFERTVYALDAATGKQLWTAAMGNWVWGSPALVGQRFVRGGSRRERHRPVVENGKAVWPKPFNAGGAIRADVLVRDGVVFIVAEHGHADALDAATGAAKWQYTSDAAAKAGGFLSTPVLTGNILYVVSGGGPDLRDRYRQWQ